MSDILELKKAADGLQTAFEAHKKANDEALKEMATKGHVDALLKEKLDKIDADLTSFQEQITKAARLPAGKGGEKALSEDEQKHFDAFYGKGGYLRKGRDEGLSDLQLKAMSVGSDPDGGYAVPRNTAGRIVEIVRETSPIRQYAQVDAISLGDALEGMYDDDEASSGWVGETDEREETDTPQSGMWKVELHEQYAEPRISQRLLDDASYDVEGWLQRKVAEKLSREENYAFIRGNGAKQPKGLFAYETSTAADGARARGVFQHIVTGAAGAFAAANPADCLHDLVGAVKQAYRQGSIWVTNKATVTAIRKLKDANEHYLWQPGLQAGQPATLLGYGIAEMEDVAAMAANSLSLGFGNVRLTYQIVDKNGIFVLRDPYTRKGFVKYYTTKRTGGRAVLFEAFKFLKFSA